MVVHNIFIQILQSIVQFNLIFHQTTSSSFGRGDVGGWSLFGGGWSSCRWRRRRRHRRHRTTPSFNGEKDEIEYIASNFKDELAPIALTVHSGMTSNWGGSVTFIHFLCLFLRAAAAAAAFAALPLGECKVAAFAVRMGRAGATVKALPSLNCKNIFSAERQRHCR